MPKVIVIGGGVAGLTAAHELAQRGFEVDVYEAREAWGGKARSQPVPGSGTNGRKDLPGEHGFRFYPRFYRHVVDMMKRTPTADAAIPSTRPNRQATIAMARQPMRRRRTPILHFTPICQKARIKVTITAQRNPQASRRHAL